MTDSDKTPAAPGRGPWLVLLLVAAGAAAYVATRSRAPRVDDGESTVMGSGFVQMDPGAVPRVVVEAESPVAVSDPLPASPVRVLRIDQPDGLSDADRARLIAAGGSGGALYIGPEKFNDTWKGNLDAGKVTKDDKQFGHPDASIPGFARYTFRVPETGSYALWVRAFWVDDCGNSVGVAVNDGPLFPLTDSNVGRWTWRRLENAERAARPFALDAGRDHTLTLVNREDDCYIDQVMFRVIAPGLPVPTGPETSSEATSAP